MGRVEAASGEVGLQHFGPLLFGDLAMGAPFGLDPKFILDGDQEPDPIDVEGLANLGDEGVKGDGGRAVAEESEAAVEEGFRGGGIEAVGGLVGVAVEGDRSVVGNAVNGGEIVALPRPGVIVMEAENPQILRSPPQRH